MYRTPFPACNVPRRNEATATDTGYSDTPAIGGGETAAQLFVGRDSLVSDVYGLKTEKQFVNTLQDTLRRRTCLQNTIRLSFGVQSPKEITAGMRMLADAVRSCVG